MQVQYRLVSPSSFFLIDATTGEIRSKERLHFDETGTHNLYSLYVEAQDLGTPSFTSLAAVNVEILDSNDHPPVFVADEYFSG